jgi:hypothetical protein
MSGEANRGAPLSARASVTTSGSTQIFASAASTKWFLTKGFIGWSNVSGGATIDIMEQSTSIFRFMVPATGGGFEQFDLGERGHRASDSNTSLRLNLNASGTVSGIFVGYRRGERSV